MSNWLSKSNTSFSIASDGKNPHLDNRVHCYYYSCVQRLFYILNSKIGMSEEDIDNQCNPKVSGNGGTHTWLAKYFEEYLVKQTHHLDSLDLKKYLSYLKQKRVLADYKMASTEPKDLKQVEDFYNKVKNILDRRFP